MSAAAEESCSGQSQKSVEEADVAKGSYGAEVDDGTGSTTMVSEPSKKPACRTTSNSSVVSSRDRKLAILFLS